MSMHYEESMTDTPETTSPDPQRPSPHTDTETAALAKIAELPGPYRAMGERLHAVIRATAPALAPRTWYGMPAYARDGKVVVFFRGGTAAEPERYMTLGFSEDAALDEGSMWPTSFALAALGPDEEARVTALVKKAAG
jgi:uncharacterized protein YdhG (YjbR/CyaY superfamily)